MNSRRQQIRPSISSDFGANQRYNLCLETFNMNTLRTYNYLTSVCCLCFVLVRHLVAKIQPWLFERWGSGTCDTLTWHSFRCSIFQTHSSMFPSCFICRGRDITSLRPSPFWTLSAATSLRSSPGRWEWIWHLHDVVCLCVSAHFRLLCAAISVWGS